MSKYITNITLLATYVALLINLSGCARTGESHSPVPKKVIRTVGRPEIKPPPVITHPQNIGDVQYGMSSYYAEQFHGKRTANGEIYDMFGISAAHQTLPLNTIVTVTNLENNKVLTMKINDRGPFIKGRILDCSYGAAVKLNIIRKGTAMVKIEVIEIGNNKYNKIKE